MSEDATRIGDVAEYGALMAVDPTVAEQTGEALVVMNTDGNWRRVTARGGVDEDTVESAGLGKRRRSQQCDKRQHNRSSKKND
ncbi:hypothetical protein PIB30_109952, partial [Stylosanthes scabra]|nr:hypothetical protein [Stylosanthes scabra]